LFVVIRHRLLTHVAHLTAQDMKTLIFSETKRGADNLCRQLRSSGYPALAIHGDKEQRERDWVLQEFRDGKSQILIATDVAARGLGTVHFTSQLNIFLFSSFPKNHCV
jgi:ATP-dependent RNA helicase DDX5/DBP2